MSYLNQNLKFFLLAAIVLHILFLSPPENFPSGQIIMVQPGASLKKISAEFKDESVIRSRAAFQSFAILFAGDKNIRAGGYYFERRLPAYAVAWRLARGNQNLAPVKITLTEGLNSKEMAAIFKSDLPYFNDVEFLALAKEKEGYLFPDTYFFNMIDGPKDLIERMTDNFSVQIKSIEADLDKSGRKLHDIIIMASLIEREASATDDRSIISGILWKRIKEGYRLQVDVDPDTYKHYGLPPAPIGNPGMKSILAAATPKDSPYLYYVHDKKGVIHYAKTFDEHKRNIALYLK